MYFRSDFVKLWSFTSHQYVFDLSNHLTLLCQLKIQVVDCDCTICIEPLFRLSEPVTILFALSTDLAFAVVGAAFPRVCFRCMTSKLELVVETVCAVFASEGLLVIGLKIPSFGLNFI